MDKFMQKAIKEAKNGIHKKHGGPFGAVIVKGNKIIAKSHNQVLKTNNPTAHAEILAIQKASKKLKRFNLSDCTLYATSEPCPMCFGAIYWAKIKKVYYGCTKEDAKKIGFDDSFIYREINKPNKKTKFKQIDKKYTDQLFKEFSSKSHKLY